MSLRAYKIEKIVYAKEATFNVGEEWFWLDTIPEVWKAFNESGECYQLEFHCPTLKEERKKQKYNAHQKKIINKILLQADGDEFVTFACH